MLILPGVLAAAVFGRAHRAITPLDGTELASIGERQRSLLPGARLLVAVWPEDVREGDALCRQLVACRDAGAGGFTFPAYGLLREHQLKAIGEARAA